MEIKDISCNLSFTVDEYKEAIEKVSENLAMIGYPQCEKTNEMAEEIVILFSRAAGRLALVTKMINSQLMEIAEIVEEAFVILRPAIQNIGESLKDAIETVRDLMYVEEELFEDDSQNPKPRMRFESKELYLKQYSKQIKLTNIIHRPRCYL